MITDSKRVKKYRKLRINHKKKHLQHGRCLMTKIPGYFSSRSSTVQPSTLEMRYRDSALALLMSLFLCSYI